MHKNYFARLITLGIIVLSLIATGCAVKKSAWGNLKTGLILKNRLAKDQTLTYKGSADAVQSLKLMGRSIETTIKSDISYSLKGNGIDDQKNLMVQVIINHINMAINSPQGNINPDTSALNGKSFGATYSPDGKELKVTGVEDLPKISLGQGGERNAKDLFSDLLAALPDTAIKTGGSWTTPIDKKLQQGQIAITIKGEATSVLEGVETVKGMECVKITTRTKNAIQGSGTQMGQELNLKGDATAASTWYFAYKKGILVNSITDEDSNIKINVANMEIPQATKSKTDVELVL